jgi:hypothetical protein
MNRRLAVCGACIYTALAGLLLLGLGWFVVNEANTPAATVLFVLGGGALVTAPFVARLEGTLRIGPVQLTVRQQVIKAVKSATEDSLAGVLPLLTSEDISVSRSSVPSRFEGHRLVDDELAFLRQKLNVSVLGVLLPGEERWRAGGAVSELELQKGAQMLVAGHPDTLAYLRFLIASDDEELWRRVT